MRPLNLIRHLETGTGATPATPSSAFDEQKPASALLRRLSGQWDAINHCKNKFPRKVSREYTSASLDSLHVACVAVFATMMSELETFQRVLYAGCYEYSIHLAAFEPDQAFKNLDKKELSPRLLAGYRGAHASVGRLVADSLGNWHDPAAVNCAFHGFAKWQLYDAVAIEDLKLMWQLRHSIVHTGGWITRPDSQKLSAISGLADHPITVGFPFIDSATRRLYRTISACVSNYGHAYIGRLAPATPAPTRAEIDDLFSVSGPRNAWI